MMNQQAIQSTSDASATTGNEHAILVTSIGTASASIIAALKHATNVPEQLLAHRLFQAPSILFGNLPEKLAVDVVAVLRNAGVSCAVVTKEHHFQPGDSDHEIALVIRDVKQMKAILEGVMSLLGVSVWEAKQLVCATPAILIGRVSAATVDAVRQRFEGLGVEVDVSKPSEARFDVFLTNDSKETRAACEKLVTSIGGGAHLSANDGGGSMLAADLPREVAERLHSEATRAKQALVILSRDFQRFDIRLEAAPNSTEVTKFLVETAAMPERIVPKVLARLPIVTHSCVRYSAMREHLQTLEALGAHATAQLTSFQRFGLVIETVKDAKSTTTLLRDLGGLSQGELDRALRGGKEPLGAFSGPLARWLQRELDLQGTKTRMVLR